MLDIQTLVEADESYRKLLITELLALDRNWSFINNKLGGNPDQKQIRVGLQIKLALLSLVQDYRREQEIAAGLVDLPGLLLSSQSLLVINSICSWLRVRGRRSG